MSSSEEERLTRSVLDAMAGTPDPRLREVMQSLVRHLHAFVREVRPSVAEWRAGVEFVVGIGQATNDSHHEVILTSDTWGVSSLVDLINAAGDGTTEAALLGPFWRADVPFLEKGSSIAADDAKGVSVLLTGTVRDRAGNPIRSAVVDVWQTDADGYYDNQYPGGALHLRGRFRTDDEGRYALRTIKPVPYPIPVHGPVGQLTLAQRRSIYRPAHIHAMVSAPGYRTLITQIFSAGDPYLGCDVTFSVVGGLIGPYRPAAPEDGVDERLEFDFILAEGESVLPDAPVQ